MTRLEEFETVMLGLIQYHKNTNADNATWEALPDYIDDVAFELYSEGISKDEINKARDIIYSSLAIALRDGMAKDSVLNFADLVGKTPIPKNQVLDKAPVTCIT